MPTPNPEVQRMLDQAKRELAELRAQKAREFPANPHPFAQPDAFPKNYTQEQVQRHSALNAQIESLENRIEELQNRLYRK